MPVKPNLDYLADIAHQAQVTWAPLLARDDRIFAHYWWRNPILSPKHIQMELVRSGLVPDTLNRIVGILLRDPAWEVIRLNLSRREQERSTELEDYLAGVRYETIRAANTNPEMPFYLDLAATGRAIWQVIAEPYKWSEEAGFPVRELALDDDTEDLTDDDYLDMVKKWKYAAATPITWQCLPAKAVWYNMDEGHVASEVLIRKSVRMADLRASYGNHTANNLAQDIAGSKSDTKVVIYEYWNPGWYMAAVTDALKAYDTQPDHFRFDASVVLQGPREHNYGRVPIVVVEAQTTTATTPLDRIVPPIFDIVNIAEHIDWYLSMMGTDARQHAFRTMVYQVSEDHPPEADPQGRPKIAQIVDGQTFGVWSDESIKPLLEGNPDPGPQRMVELGLSLAAQNGLAPVVRGETSGISSGYHQNTAYLQAVSKLKPVSENVTIGYEQWARLVFSAIEVLDQEVPIYFQHRETRNLLAIGPSDIKGSYRIRALYRPDIPRDMTAAIQAATLLKQGGLADDNWIRENILHITDSDKIQDALSLQSFDKNPMRQETLLVRALERAGELEQTDNTQALLNLVGDYEHLPPGLQRALATRGIGPTPQNPQMPLPGAGSPGVTNPNPAAMTGGMRLPPGRAAGTSREPPIQPVTPTPP